MKPDFKSTLGVDKKQATLLVLFIPSVDRYKKEVDQDTWVQQAMQTLGSCFGGATAFPKALGVWKDDDNNGVLIYDEPVIINCYTSEEELEKHVGTLKALLLDIGEQTNQGAVGLVIDRDYLEIKFPLKDNENG